MAKMSLWFSVTGFFDFLTSPLSCAKMIIAQFRGEFTRKMQVFTRRGFFMNRLTFNILFFLIIQAKITKSGRMGNGKILIKLLSIIADCENDGISKEWNMLKLFDSGANKSAIYKKIDRLTIDFMKTGNRFPSEKIQMQNFEKKSAWTCSDWLLKK